MQSATRCCPCRSPPRKWWWLRPSPSLRTGWRRWSVSPGARCAAWWPARWTFTGLLQSFLPWPSPCVPRRRQGATPGAVASSSWWSWARATSSSTPTTRAWSRWWTGSGNMPLTSARATSTWNHGAPTAFGEKMVMRIFDPDNAVKDLDALGFAQHDAERWEALVKRPHGIILVTGPTGSGKTTTLYSTLKRVATEEVNVSTVEDPIEMIEPSFNQTQVQPQLDFNFAEGLRALMRQDPDIIMVGEIRDLETAEMAIQAALTGHLVFSTLHTNDAPSAITRMMELGGPPYLLNATLLGVLAQRLVRTLCQQCKQKDETAQRETLVEVVKPWKLSGGYHPYKPVGCVDCRMGGFRGRMGLYELLTVTEALKEKINQAPSIDQLRRQAVQDGMRPLRLAGALRVAEGLTTLDEVIAATPPLE